VQLPEHAQVLAEERAGTLVITLNRPQVRNAMSVAMIDQLLLLLDLAVQEQGMRAIVLRGAEGNFCAGADIKDMAAARALPVSAAEDPVVKVNASFGRLCSAYARTSLPVICALEGAVMGGGFGLACVSDVTLAAASTVFALPETSLGVVPAQIAPFLVERLGFAQAKRLAITGGRIRADEALGLGLVHEVLPTRDALDAALERTLDKIYACAPGATRATKQLMQRARLEPADSLVEHAAHVFASAARGPEGAEGTLAFLQKRKPGWAQRS
jgi:isohexenylglutaconyl-CoA hydratase